MLRGEVVGDGVGDFFLEAGDRRAGLLRHGDQDVIGMPPVVIDIHLGANAGFLHCSLHLYIRKGIPIWQSIMNELYQFHKYIKKLVSSILHIV